MPCANTAVERVHASVQAENEATHDRLEPKAVEAIVDDLTCGLSYPRKGFPRIEIGDYFAEQMDEDEIARALTVLVYGGDDRGDVAYEIRQRYEAGLADWLRAKHQRFIEMKVEELADEERLWAEE